MQYRRRWTGKGIEYKMNEMDRTEKIESGKKILYSVDYDKVVIFKERINRFTVRFQFEEGEREGEQEKGEKKVSRQMEDLAHLHDTGRMRELLVEGAKLLVKKADMKKMVRKTRWDVIGVKAGEEIILINTVFHRYITEAVFRQREISPFDELLYVKPEYKYGKSKIDFYLESEKEKIFVEVKGCTLVENGIAKFPGAPSSRAIKHLEELMKLRKEGFRTAVFILIFRKSEAFAPEHNIDRKFSECFYKAIDAGVEIYPMLLRYENRNIYFEKNIKVLEKRF